MTNTNQTHYGSGDNVAGDKIIIESLPRNLTETLSNQLLSLMDKNKKVRITAVMGDEEAFNFATKIKDFLISKEYKIEGVDRALYSEPILGQIINQNEEGDFEIIIGKKS